MPDTDGHRVFFKFTGDLFQPAGDRFGKDRAGFVSAVLECLMGASADEVKADYMVTFYNYYGVLPGTEQYDAIARSNILKSLATAFEVEDIYACDLAAEAEEYLKSIGVSEEDIAAAKAKLG